MTGSQRVVSCLKHLRAPGWLWPGCAAFFNPFSDAKGILWFALQDESPLLAARATMTEPPSESLYRKKPARPLRQRIGQRIELLPFSLVCGASWRDRVRLFYEADLKPSLVFRGWGRYSLERILPFGINASGNTRFRVYARDNRWDAGTIAAFFSPRYRIIPAGLPPLRPELI